MFLSCLLATIFAASTPTQTEQAPASLPDNITVTLDFTKGSPFVEAYVSADKQTRSGEVYTYPYKYTAADGSEAVLNLKFRIYKLYENETVSYTDLPGKGLSSATLYGGYSIGIEIPGVEGMYLKSVKVNQRCSFPENPGHMSGSKYKPDGNLAKEFIFPDYFETEMGKPYYYHQRRENMILKTVIVKYSKNRP